MMLRFILYMLFYIHYMLECQFLTENIYNVSGLTLAIDVHHLEAKTYLTKKTPPPPFLICNMHAK